MTFSSPPPFDEDANSLLTAFQYNSCLTFTCEQSKQKRLPFLDIDITKDENGFRTKVYIKDTNVGRCHNARGECPPAYKRSVDATYINRALTYCSSWTETHHELERIRQLFTNNGYSEEMIEGLVRKKLDNFTAPAQTPVSPDCKITIYYQSRYHDRYKDECHAIRGIIKRGATPTDSNNTIDLRIYAKPNLTRFLFMRNNTAPRTHKEASTNVIYEFSCQESPCDGSNTYIGRTSTTLRRHLLYRRNQGAIFQYYIDHHDQKPPLQKLIDSTTTLLKESNYRKMQIAEAVAITSRHPNINAQVSSDYILPSARPHEHHGLQPQHEQPPRETRAPLPSSGESVNTSCD
ncbi:uncharacterized protein LOC143040121 [Oratosquilla oratoria]|uniref:uncharacterized protein LOC143040121 n=1 Tax=Oratosquilla oratoria TaxID=337810 RepID=UPI003F777151